MQNQAANTDGSIQVQSVLYKCDPAMAERSLQSIANALQVDAQVNGAPRRCVVVHGDASPERLLDDAAVEEIRVRYESVFEYRYVFFDRNTGTSLGHNMMFEGCDTEYLVIQNPDVMWSPHVVDRGVALLGDPARDAGALDARQVPLEHPKHYDPRTWEQDWCSGACLMLPSRVYAEVGGFDAGSFFMYCDDVDISYRIKLAGYRLYYNPTMPVYHAKPLSTTGHWVPTEAEKFFSMEANLLMAYKYCYDDIFQGMYDSFSKGDEAAKKVIALFEERKAQGRLPERLDPGHTVTNMSWAGFGRNRYYY